jgi:two-component system CheB/CheR fusion protein
MGVSKQRRKKSAGRSAGTPLRTPTKIPAPVGALVEAPAEDTETLDKGLPFSVVGVGASAGGLEAFTQLLRALPADTGMAFVLVQHLAPKHESALAEILSRATSMRVTEVADEPELEPNRVYVIPPDRNMVIVRSHLRLLPREESGKQHPIDQFFRSLAGHQGHMAIGVVLSGTATDGTLGLEEIKAEGGITFAQDASAMQGGMPQSAVASGCVDFVLPPAAIAEEIARIGTHPYVSARLNSEETETAKRETTHSKDSLAPILHALRNATGTDFTEYKVNTLLRRIRRRMVLQKKDHLNAYATFLRENSGEARALYDDLLINVTSFFRDPEMFAELKKQVLPTLLKGRSRHDPVRLWVVGCSTGEEAYSLAILLSEATDSSGQRVPVQVFATDLNDSGIEQARAGVYSKERLQNISRERLRRFFVDQSGGYRVAKSIRDICVFSQHNVMADPPFSRMDLVSCRNLLIYMDTSLQQRILPILHYALKPAGFLVLGASETTGRFTDLFESGESRHKIYAKKVGTTRGAPVPVLGRQPAARFRTMENAPRSLAPTTGASSQFSLPGKDVNKEADRLLATFAPPSVLVDGNLEILQFRGNIEPYLSPAQGRASFALLKMAREGLLVPLQALLHRAKKDNVTVREEGLRVTSSEGQRTLNLEVIPIEGSSPQAGCFLVLFKDIVRADEQDSRAGKAARKPKSEPAAAARKSSLEIIARLEQELANTRNHLQVVMEQYEAANEELQSSNEEAQSANEELQSINEELETSKEEIQSSNEELTTVNDELNNRNLEVGQLNNDLTNLIGSAQLAIIIVGLDLCIRRFSPMAEKLLSVIPADVGRPITNIRMNLAVPNLDSILEEVIETVSPKEFQVKDKQGRWWSLRLRPYMTLDKKIDGAALMLVDIDELKASEQSIAAARDYLRKWEHMFDHAGWAVATTHPDTGALELVNPAFAQMHGYTVAELIGRPLSSMIAPESHADVPQEVRLGKPQGDYVYESAHVRKDGTTLLVLTHVTVLKDDTGRVLYRAATFQDITERKRLEKEVRERNETLAAADAAKNNFIAVLSHELRSPLNVIHLWSQILQQPGRGPDDLRKGLDIIAHGCKAQSQLIEDLLDVHRITSGMVRLALAQVDLGEITRLVVDSLAPIATEKGIVLDDQGIDRAPVVVAGDSARLQQVLRNVLGNALKFTPNGGKVRVTLRRNGKSAELSVSDTGRGMTTESLSRLFEPFRNAHPVTMPNQGGLGLGLSIAKNLVDLHGGLISSASPGPGKGSTFTVVLPLLSAEEMHAPVLERSKAQGQSMSLNGICVLVVENEGNAREAIRRVLEGAGAQTVQAASAKEALAAMQRRLPDVIVSDIGMPGQDGNDLLRSIRALPAEQGGRIPAIALTAYVTSEDRARTLSAGFQAHIAKPADANEIIAAVATHAPSRT